MTTPLKEALDCVFPFLSLMRKKEDAIIEYINTVDADRCSDIVGGVLPSPSKC